MIEINFINELGSYSEIGEKLKGTVIFSHLKWSSLSFLTVLSLQFSCSNSFCWKEKKKKTQHMHFFVTKLKEITATKKVVKQTKKLEKSKQTNKNNMLHCMLFYP